MINMQTIMEEISKLEESQASYPVCQKLADLYIVKDHLMQKQGGDYTSNYSYYDRGGNGRSNYGMYRDNEYYDARMYTDMDMNKPRMSNPVMR